MAKLVKEDRVTELGFEKEPGFNTFTKDSLYQERNAINTQGVELAGTVVEDVHMDVIINGQTYQINLKKT